MTRPPITFSKLIDSWDWVPIPNCPGRFKLNSGDPFLAPETLIEMKVPAREYQSPAARDAVLVTLIDGGGILSYRRPDGTFLHTLNTSDGLRRKVIELGLDQDEVLSEDTVND